MLYEDCEYEKWTKDSYYHDPWKKTEKELEKYTYEKMVKQLEKTQDEFNNTFGQPRIGEETVQHGVSEPISIVHGQIITKNGKSYIQIDGEEHELDFDDPESIGKLIIKSIARHLLEE